MAASWFGVMAGLTASVCAMALGVAEVVPREEAAGGTLAAAVDRVLGSEEMRIMAAAQAARLRATDPPAVAAALLESLL